MCHAPSRCRRQQADESAGTARPEGDAVARGRAPEHGPDRFRVAAGLARGAGRDRGSRARRGHGARQSPGARHAGTPAGTERQAPQSNRRAAEAKMTVPAWREEAISKKHDRKSFDCGEPALNEFLQRYARQSHEAGGAKTFVAVKEADGKTILGYYSLAPAALAYADTPELMRRGLARHDVPGFRLARLATDLKLQGQGLGGQLLAAAARRCLRASAEVGGVVLIIDAKNDRAAQWYAGYGAVPLRGRPW